MATNEEIEEYLIETELPFEEVEEGLWLIHDDVDYIDNIVVYHTPPVVTFRVKLMEVPETGTEPRLELFKQLLDLNATSMVAGAYGLENENVVVVDTLQSENLDFNEFQASLDAITLAIREHYHLLKDLVARVKGEAPEASAGEETTESDDVNV